MHTNKLSLVIGADHRGYRYKELLKQQLTDKELTIDWNDVGAFNEERSDYPLFAQAACSILLEKKADYGILLCGTGIGMAIAANRFPGIYAGLVWNEELAVRAKEEDCVNVLVLPADFITASEALLITQAWLRAEFKKDRYQKRIEMIDKKA